MIETQGINSWLVYHFVVYETVIEGISYSLFWIFIFLSFRVVNKTIFAEHW